MHLEHLHPAGELERGRDPAGEERGETEEGLRGPEVPAPPGRDDGEGEERGRGDEEVGVVEHPAPVVGVPEGLLGGGGEVEGGLPGRGEEVRLAEEQAGAHHEQAGDEERRAEEGRGVVEEMVPGAPRPHDGVGEKGRRPEGHRGAVGPDREGEKPGGCGEPEGPAARRRRQGEGAERPGEVGDRRRVRVVRPPGRDEDRAREDDGDADPARPAAVGPGKKDVEGHDRDQGEQVAEGEEPPDRPEGEVGGARRHEEADPGRLPHPGGRGEDGGVAGEDVAGVDDEGRVHARVRQLHRRHPPQAEDDVGDARRGDEGERLGDPPPRTPPAPQDPGPGGGYHRPVLNGRRVAIVLPAYNAGGTLARTVGEIDREVVDELVLVDDASTDDTVRLARSLGLAVHRHEEVRGYGGNQKSCYRLALALGADIVVMVHPDYQYSPRLVPAMAAMIAYGQYDFVLGSRILAENPVAEGMPRYKYVANRVLTLVENAVLRQKLSEYHTGLRAYSRQLLAALPFERNSEDFVFDNQIIAQAIAAGARIGELSCPTRYAADSSSIDLRRSVTYGLGVLRTTAQYRLQRLGVRHYPYLAVSPLHEAAA